MTDSTSLPTSEPLSPEAEQAIRDRFMGALRDDVPTAHQLSVAERFTSLAVDLALSVEALAPAGRNKSLAMTHLEDALVRAKKAVFDDMRPVVITVPDPKLTDEK